MTDATTRGFTAQHPGASGALTPQPPSILVLTLNEEINIASCLERLTFSDDIVVLDSFSTDRTVEIAKSFPNVTVYQRKFDTWSKHSNWALENVPWKHPWVYYSDADEHVTPELRDEILRVIHEPKLSHAAYRLRYQNMFMGRWIRHGGIYPVWIMRLFRPNQVRYEDRQVNAHPVVDGSVGLLDSHFIHYSFSKGLYLWLQKHNSYSQMEAHEAVRVRQGSFRSNLIGSFRGDKSARRRAMKNVSFYLPARDFLRFFYMVVLRAGFLDGRAGLHYAAMISMYEYWIALKAIEERRGTLGSGVCPAGQTLHQRIATDIDTARARSRELLGAPRPPRAAGHPLLGFVREYLLRGGILHGRPGWRRAKLAAGQEYMLRLLHAEARTAPAAAPVVPPTHAAV